MNLAIIAQLVQILKDAPELGAIEVRRGLFGRWSSIRVTKVGHGTNAGGGGVGSHLVVAQAPVGTLVPGSATAAAGGGPPRRRRSSSISSPRWWGPSIPRPSRGRVPM